MLARAARPACRAAPARSLSRLAPPALARRPLTGLRRPAAALAQCLQGVLPLRADQPARCVYSEAGALRARVDAEVALLDRIWGDDQTIELEDVLEVIELNYNYTPTAFRNGAVENAKDENVGSCKVITRILLSLLLTMGGNCAVDPFLA